MFRLSKFKMLSSGLTLRTDLKIRTAHNLYVCNLSDYPTGFALPIVTPEGRVFSVCANYPISIIRYRDTIIDADM